MSNHSKESMLALLASLVEKVTEGTITDKSKLRSEMLRKIATLKAE